MLKVFNKNSRLGILILIVTLVVTLLPVFPINHTNAAMTDVTIIISNIGGGTGTYPATDKSIEVLGKSIDGKSLIKVNDLATYLGCTLSNNGNEWTISRNGQSVKFTKDSTAFTSTMTYSIYYPATNTYKSHTISLSGNADLPAQIINNEKYVRLTAAANQLGALMVGYQAPNAYVWDWRVNQNIPFSDTNNYVVGGPWVTNWSSLGTTTLTDHFSISELRDTSSSASNPNYYSQLKMSVNQLQSLENVRYHYNSNTGFTPTSGFRSWEDNRSTGGSWDKSFHMRGRAWDAGEDNLYNGVYNEFKGTYSAPIDATTYWRTRVSNGQSGGYEIEKMPVGSSTWLHLQRQPGYDTASSGP